MRRCGAEITETRRSGARDSAGGTAASSTGSAARLSEIDKKGIFYQVEKNLAHRLVSSQSVTNFSASFTFHHWIADAAVVMILYP